MANIVENIASAENLTTLLQAIEVTQLEETLKSTGIFTVFAPTNEAFATLPTEMFDALQKDTSKLKRIIAYHIGFGDVRAEDLLEIEEVMTMEGSIIAVDASNGQIRLNDANVINADILVDNGVIHLIDKVLAPALVLSE